MRATIETVGGVTTRYLHHGSGDYGVLLLQGRRERRFFPLEPRSFGHRELPGSCARSARLWHDWGGRLQRWRTPGWYRRAFDDVDRTPWVEASRDRRQLVRREYRSAFVLENPRSHRRRRARRLRAGIERRRDALEDVRAIICERTQGDG